MDQTTEAPVPEQAVTTQSHVNSVEDKEITTATTDNTYLQNIEDDKILNILAADNIDLIADEVGEAIGDQEDDEFSKNFEENQNLPEPANVPSQIAAMRLNG